MRTWLTGVCLSVLLVSLTLAHPLEEYEVHAERQEAAAKNELNQESLFEALYIETKKRIDNRQIMS